MVSFDGVVRWWESFDVEVVRRRQSFDGGGRLMVGVV